MEQTSRDLNLHFIFEDDIPTPFWVIPERLESPQQLELLGKDSQWRVVEGDMNLKIVNSQLYFIGWDTVRIEYKRGSKLLTISHKDTYWNFFVNGSTNRVMSATCQWQPEKMVRNHHWLSNVGTVHNDDIFLDKREEVAKLPRQKRLKKRGSPIEERPDVSEFGIIVTLPTNSLQFIGEKTRVFSRGLFR